MNNAAKNFDILVTNLSGLHNYLDNSINFRLALKFYTFSAKPFFPYNTLFMKRTVLLK